MPRKFDIRDFKTIAEEIVDLRDSRKRKRRDFERIWDEVDRQIRMEPDIGFKLLPPDGSNTDRVDPKKAWMPEMELPLQAQALEVLTADARRMLSPDAGPWFEAHAELSDEYLQRAEGVVILPDGEVEQIAPQAIQIAGENDPPSLITQDAANKLIMGVINHNHRQYDFWGNIDLINAEAFKYGMGVARGRMVKKSVFMHTARGVTKANIDIPVLFPRPLRNTYLDDSEHALMNEGHILGPGTIFESFQRVEDVRLAANRGLTNPHHPDGGWMPAQMKDMEGDKDNNIMVLEFEGDLIVSRKTVRSIIMRGVIVTVAKGNKTRVIRTRFRQMPFSSYLFFPYNPEDQKTPYSSSPLTKGMLVQKAAVLALNTLLQVAALNAQPPTSWDRSDLTFALEGGPIVQPGASWPTLSEIITHQIGDPAALFNIYFGVLKQYEDLTGVNAPRLGAQTVSHTTAFAKQAELTRGTVRTVDYVRNTLKGPLTKWLGMEYKMTRRTWKTQSVFLDPYKSFVTLERRGLPDNAVFELFGSGGPEEAQQKQQQKAAAIQQALQLDEFLIQQQQPPNLDIAAVQRQILSEGGWTDVDTFIRSDAASEGDTSEPPLEGDSGGDPNAAAVSLQALRP